jgi:hypothetical protein
MKHAMTRLIVISIMVSLVGCDDSSESYGDIAPSDTDGPSVTRAQEYITSLLEQQFPLLACESYTTYVGGCPCGPFGD